MGKNTIYGYARISTMKQSLERQIENIKKEYPEAVIYTERYRGTTLDRPSWNELRKHLKTGDSVVFDEVSRMSRSASEGFALYHELYKEGINLIFLKERHLDTEVYSNTLKSSVTMTGTDIDCILKGVNEYLMVLAKRQIEIAFQTAQHEVDLLHQRTSEGVRKAQAAGKQVGRKRGDRVLIKKAEPIKALIKYYSKDFDGNLSDKDVMTILGSRTITIPVQNKAGQGALKTQSAKVARNTYYKYKAELKQALLI